MTERLDLDPQQFTDLRDMVFNDNTGDLVFAINRWSSLKRSMNDGASLLRVLVAKVRPYWQGRSGDTALERFDNLATWMAAIALQADRNAFATEQIHTAVLTAQHEMRALTARPNKAPAFDALVTAVTGKPKPSDLDSRHAEAVRITKQLAWAYEAHTPELRPVPEYGDGRDPGLSKGALEDPNFDSGAAQPSTIGAPGGRPTTHRPEMGSPGPSLAGSAAVPPTQPTESASVVRPPSASSGPVNALPGGTGISPSFGGRNSGNPAIGANPSAGGTRTSTPSPTGNPRTATPSAPAAGKPGLPGGGMSAGGVPPSGASGRPNDRRGRRGKGTDLTEDRGIFDPNRHHTPPVIGTPRQPATTDHDDEHGQPSEHQPAALQAASERRDESGYPSQIPDHEIANKDGLRIQFKRDRG